MNLLQKYTKLFRTYIQTLRLVLMIILQLGFINILKAQYIDFPEPDWINEILYVNHNDKKLQELERQDAISDNRKSAGMQLTGISNIKSKLKVKGGSSKSELRPFFGRYQFLYKVENNNLNPKDLLRLYEWKPEGRYRTILIGQISTTGVKTGYGNPIPFRAQKYKESSYLVTIENLPPGEYGFSIGKEKNTTFMFFSIRGGKEDLLKIDELPLFNNFFEDKYFGKLSSNAKIFVSKAPGSKDFNNEVCQSLNGISAECVSFFEDANYYLEYFFGKFAKFGPQGRSFQLRLIDANSGNELISVSRNVSGEGLNTSAKMVNLLSEIFNSASQK
jgi:hypothetical protein